MTMILLFVVGAVLAYAVGMGHDMVYTMFRGMGIDAGAGTPWDSTRELWIQTGLLYFICSLPPIFGIIIFGLSITRRQRRDEFYESGEIYNQDE